MTDKNNDTGIRAARLPPAENAELRARMGNSAGAGRVHSVGCRRFYEVIDKDEARAILARSVLRGRP